MERIEFTVDAALLRQLGERLVGRPHIALAELIKNAYDADATVVDIRFDGDSIEVEDNGHGMSFNEFRDGWMRIGTPSKQRQATSRDFRRPLTGSKGVGRLSSQFLASEIELRTVSMDDTSVEVVALIDWEQATTAGDLTRATAVYECRATPPGFDSPRGRTVIRLSCLHQTWDAEAFELLARELWALQPPFDLATEAELEAVGGFEVRLTAETDTSATVRFKKTMRQVLDLDMARVRGQLVRADGAARVQVAVTFEDGEHLTHEFSVEQRVAELDFEVRVFDFRGRQAYGIKVDEARHYLHSFGGVHVYDAGFHVPYYGVDTDWLDIEKDHARRLSKSQLLPAELQISGGMTHLPTNRRLFGVVRVDTAREALADLPTPQRDRLSIQVTRDRLVDNEAYQLVKTSIRRALDFYAHNQARRVFRERDKKTRPSTAEGSADAALATLESIRDSVPEEAYGQIADALAATAEASAADRRQLNEQAGLLGALATAGMAAVAFEHELTKQLRALERTVGSLRGGSQVDLDELALKLDGWIDRARQTQALFSHLVDEEDRTAVKSIRVVDAVSATLDQVRILLGQTEVFMGGIGPELHLPKARLSEWSAVLQNLIFNAYDAMLTTSKPFLRIAGFESRGRAGLTVEDNGVGIDRERSEALFHPFVRALELPPDVRSLRLGTSGLGLTIVRMILDQLGCEGKFVEPSTGYSTAFEISWRT